MARKLGGGCGHGGRIVCEHCQPTESSVPSKQTEESRKSWEKQYVLNWQDYTDTEWFYEVKDFIRSLLSERDRRLRERIEEINEKYKDQHWQSRHALDDVLKALSDLNK